MLVCIKRIFINFLLFFIDRTDHAAMPRSLLFVCFEEVRPKRLYKRKLGQSEIGTSIHGLGKPLYTFVDQVCVLESGG